MNFVTYTLNFDGSCKPNPGIMTSAFIIRDGDRVVFSNTISGGEGTSNVAEYIGIYEGIKKALELGCKHIKIIGDSELVFNQVTGKHRCNKPKLLHYRNQIQEMLKEFYTYELTHV
ncbi:MAG: ribonuclease HI family protein, partial [Pseudomonadota bacterium]|nr:ribonuclease HI family protein [Pseudomonadota bacterium]